LIEDDGGSFLWVSGCSKEKRLENAGKIKKIKSKGFFWTVERKEKVPLYG
jgi:hypothetical protein